MFERIDFEEPKRKWTTALSFAVESLGVGLLILVPLLRPEALPAVRIDRPLTLPAAPRPVEAVTQIISTQIERPRAPQTLDDGRIHAPSQIPKTTAMGPDPTPPTNGIGNPLALPPGIGLEGPVDPLFRQLASANPPPMPTPSRPVRSKPLVISSLAEGALVNKVQPLYPPVAKSMRIQGPVVLTAVIDTNGEVVHLQAISGHPLLIGAALDAVRQWRYRPYLLNGSAIEVETRVTVVFSLQ